jgi:hypothetical protein
MYISISVYISISISVSIYTYTYAAISNGKQKPRQFSLICLQLLIMQMEICSETTLTGESRFHISTPWGFEPGSLMTGSKHSTGLPPAANYVSCEAGSRNCSEHETGTEELYEIKWDYHIVGTAA